MLIRQLKADENKNPPRVRLHSPAEESSPLISIGGGVIDISFTSYLILGAFVRDRKSLAAAILQ